MSCKFLSRLAVIAIMIGESLTSSAAFFDQNFILGSIRTEYPQGFATGGNRASLWYKFNDPYFSNEGCKWDSEDPGNFSGCPGLAFGNLWAGTLQGREACGGNATRIGDSWVGCVSYDQSPYFSINYNNGNYWVLVANSDPAFDQCNPGPPGISHPITNPITNTAKNLYKVGVENITGTTKKRLHLIINSSDHNFFCPKRANNQYIIPFLSVGAQMGRGQSSAVTTMNYTNQTADRVAFNIKVYSYSPFSCRTGTSDICTSTSSGVHTGFQMFSEWNNSKKMVFIDLFGAGSVDYSNHPIITAKWNWPIYESFMYPGAEIVYFSRNSLASNCGISLPALPTNGTTVGYTIDTSSVFKCASDLGLFTTPMPSGNVNLTGFHWYTEASGTAGHMWIGVDNMRTF